MAANLRKIMGEVPRPLEVAFRDAKDSLPVGRTRVSARDQAKRAEPLMAMIASGDVPLDEHSAQLVAAYLEQHHARTQRD